MAKYSVNIGMSDLVEDVLDYLHQSHEYYLNNALVSLASATEKLIEPCTESQKSAVWKFFQDYKAELEAHFEYEEGEVIPYVKNLLTGHRSYDYTIDRFKDNHSVIDEKLSDLKNIIMKSLPPECDMRQRRSLLIFIFGLQKDLERHTAIEDDILVPMVRMIEDPTFTDVRPSSRASSIKEELSEREKEILVLVAQGLLNKEIADRCSISVNTVITHRKNITRKTGIKTVAGLTVYAILNGLIDINSVE